MDGAIVGGLYPKHWGAQSEREGASQKALLAAVYR